MWPWRKVETKRDDRTFAEVMYQYGSASKAITSEPLGPMPMGTGLKLMEQAIRELAARQDVS